LNDKLANSLLAGLPPRKGWDQYIYITGNELRKWPDVRHCEPQGEAIQKCIVRIASGKPSQ
jgi:hypothetical protein